MNWTSTRKAFSTDMPLDEVLLRVQEHLEACPCCTGQYKLVLETLKAIEQ